MDVAIRLMRNAATAENPDIIGYQASVCDLAAHAIALVTTSSSAASTDPGLAPCSTPLPTADLIPVIDGGIAIDAFDDGVACATPPGAATSFAPAARAWSATGNWTSPRFRSTTRACSTTPYIHRRCRTGSAPRPRAVALLSASVSVELLSQFVSLIAAPRGEPEPGPLRSVLSTHTLEHLPHRASEGCHFERSIAAGDNRPCLTG